MEEQEEARSRPLERLPPELWYAVMCYLDARDLCTIRSVCRALRDIGAAPSIWRHIYERHRPAPFPATRHRGAVDWRAGYRALLDANTLAVFVAVRENVGFLSCLYVGSVTVTDDAPTFSRLAFIACSLCSLPPSRHTVLVCNRVNGRRWSPSRDDGVGIAVVLDSNRIWYGGLAFLYGAEPPEPCPRCAHALVDGFVEAAERMAVEKGGLIGDRMYYRRPIAGSHIERAMCMLCTKEQERDRRLRQGGQRCHV